MKHSRVFGSMWLMLGVVLTGCTMASAAPATPSQQASSSPDPATSSPTPAAANQSGDIGLTIYSSADPASFDPQKYIAEQRMGYNPNYVRQVPGFGVVRETRTLHLNRGINRVDFTDVARFIDPTTVTFTDLSARPRPALTVLKQTFLFDLVSPEKLLDNYLGRPIHVTWAVGDEAKSASGTLLSHVNGRLVIQGDDGRLNLVPASQAQISLGELPGGLITKPTLRWKLDSNVTGTQKVRTSYQTAGITWLADYNLVLNQDDTQANLSAWVTILNLSGKSYNDATLKLIAGNVHRVQPPRPIMYSMGGVRAAAANKAGFKEKSFYTYHMYTLPRPTDIANNTTQQITLFPTAKNVNVDKVLVYYGLPEAKNWGYLAQPRTDRSVGNKSNHKVDVYIRFKNTKDNNLGMPLPAGKVRVYKIDSDTTNNAGQRIPGTPGTPGTMEFVGEDLIDHTPRGETLLVRTGESFDIVGDRTQTAFHVDVNNQTMTESIRIELRNHKKQAAHVIIKENLYRWVNWQITQHSAPYKKIDSRTIHFPVTVPANGKKVVTYTVKYTW